MTGYVLARAAWGRGYATEALQAVVEVAEAAPDAAIEVADSEVVLRARHQAAPRLSADVVRGMGEFLAVREFLALGPFEEGEMVEDRVRERRQADDDAGGVVARRNGKIRSRQMRRAADRHREIAGER